MDVTLHAQTRSQQRGIPPLLVDLLRTYGSRDYDHHGGIVRFLDKRARRMIERSIAPEVRRRLSSWMDIYVVESANDGNIITVGHRYKRIVRH